MQGVRAIPQERFDEIVEASQPKRSYKAIVEKMLAEGPVRIVCDDRADARQAQVSLHAVYQRYAQKGEKLTTRSEGRVVFASLIVPV